MMLPLGNLGAHNSRLQRRLVLLAAPSLVRAATAAMRGSDGPPRRRFGGVAQPVVGGRGSGRAAADRGADPAADVCRCPVSPLGQSFLPPTQSRTLQSGLTGI